ncbi:hypothetical protein F2Q68_00030815 [Brassica cretica]|uniref:Uncharacterized protein n=1 Tax=Brassica cretica TaxID=69181 RepID=A0A8S9G5U0_BRACR|nr:hypothetical protein F2Q68_00030815 [Brassica cretica]
MSSLSFAVSTRTWDELGVNRPGGSSELWVCVRCFFFRCCRLSLEVPAAARNESRDSIRVSLVVSVLQSRALDCDSAVGGSNLQFPVPNDGTAYLWTLPRAAGLYPLLQGLNMQRASLKKAKTTRWITSSREDSRNSRQYLKTSITKIENGANLMVIWSTFDPRIHGLVLTSWEIIALEDRLLPKQQSISHLRHPALPRRNRRSKQSIESRFATQGSGARVSDIDEEGL